MYIYIYVYLYIIYIYIYIYDVNYTYVGPPLCTTISGGCGGYPGPVGAINN